MDWLRWWHGSSDDPKIRMIASECNMPVASVIGLWVTLLEAASKSQKRGVIENFDFEVAEFHLGIDVVTPCNAMKRRKMLHETDGALVVCNWDKWQPKREREDNSSERVRKHRELKKQSVIDCENHVTPCNASETKVTPREEKIREEVNNNIYVADRSATVQQSASAKPNCPAEAIIDLYHELMPLNPSVKVLNDARRRTIRARWKEAAELDCQPFGYTDRASGIAAWRRFFEVCAESDFLIGKAPPTQPGRPPFIADIDFLMSPAGFAKCLENKYHREMA